VLRLPDLQQPKNAVLNSLAAPSSQKSYGHAIDEFIAWYRSEPRLAFSRSVVLRYRFGRQAIADTHTQACRTLYPTDAGGDFGAEQPGVGRLVGKPSDGGQANVDRGGSRILLLQIGSPAVGAVSLTSKVVGW
jgi:hypothetical protein